MNATEHWGEIEGVWTVPAMISAVDVISVNAVVFGAVFVLGNVQYSEYSASTMIAVMLMQWAVSLMKQPFDCSECASGTL